jgi:hypothetical protein
LGKKKNMKIDRHTGNAAGKYSGTIETGISRLMIMYSYAGGIAELDACKLSLSLASKNFNGTVIPELSIAQLADIAGTLDGVRFDDIAGTGVIFSIPVSLGGAFSNTEGVLSYAIQGANVGSVIELWAIDDLKKEEDFISITAVGTQAGVSKTVPVRDCIYCFLNPSDLTRVKLTYAGNKSIEYTTLELQEIARVTNPVQKVTEAGALTCGYDALMGINTVEAVEIELTMVNGNPVYLLKQINK